MLDLSGFEHQPVRCAGLGEVLFDLYEDGPHLGGAPANFAYHCQQHGLAALVISAVGRDALGLQARLALARSFLPSLLFENDQPTGAVHVRLEDGTAHYEFEPRSAYDALPQLPELLELAGELDAVCFGTLAQRAECSRQTIMAFLEAMPPRALRIFDVNLRAGYYSPELIAASLRHANIVKCNDRELGVLCKMAGVPREAQAYRSYLRDQGIDCFICTSGSGESTVFFNNIVSTLPSPRVRVVDTVGAGDAFLATLLAALLRNATVDGAHALAADYAAFVCTQSGGMPQVPRSLTR